MPGVLAAWLVEIGLITWRGIKSSSPTGSISGLPLPADYLATFVLFGGLGALAKTKASGLGAAIAWGLVLATYMNIVDPANPLGSKSTSSTTTTVLTGA